MSGTTPLREVVELDTGCDAMELSFQRISDGALRFVTGLRGDAILLRNDAPASGTFLAVDLVGRTRRALTIP